MLEASQIVFSTLSYKSSAKMANLAAEIQQAAMVLTQLAIGSYVYGQYSCFDGSLEL